MAQLSSLLSRVSDEFPAVPELLALRALSDAFKEFCVRSHAWQDSIPSISLRPGRVTFDISLDDGVQLVAIREMRLNGKRIDAYATSELHRLRAKLGPQGEPAGYIQITPTALELVAPVSANMRVDVKAALTLARGATTTELPDAIVDEYDEAIGMGAKARLVCMASQPWYAPDTAPMYRAQFYEAITAAKRRAIFALGEADARIQMRDWV